MEGAAGYEEGDTGLSQGQRCRWLKGKGRIVASSALRIKIVVKRWGCSRVPGGRHGPAVCASKVAGRDAAGGRREDLAGHVKKMNNVNVVKTSVRLQHDARWGDR